METIFTHLVMCKMRITGWFWMALHKPMQSWLVNWNIDHSKFMPQSLTVNETANSSRCFSLPTTGPSSTWSTIGGSLLTSESLSASDSSSWESDEFHKFGASVTLHPNEQNRWKTITTGCWYFISLFPITHVKQTKTYTVVRWQPPRTCIEVGLYTTKNCGHPPWLTHSVLIGHHVTRRWNWVRCLPDDCRLPGNWSTQIVIGLAVRYALM